MVSCLETRATAVLLSVLDTRSLRVYLDHLALVPPHARLLAITISLDCQLYTTT